MKLPYASSTAGQGSVVARMVAMVLTFQSIVSPAATGPSTHVAQTRMSMVAATMARKRITRRSPP